VQLIGGSGTAPMLAYERGKRPPNIPARKSTVQELVSAAPELLQKGLNIADRMMAVLGDDNQAALSSTLRNADRFATTLGEKAMTVGRALDNVDAASTAMLDAAKAINDMVARLDKVAQGTDQTLGSIRGTFGRADRVLDRDIPTLVSEFRETAKSFTRMSEDLRRLVADNREAIGDFSTSGLIEFAKFVEEARTLVSTLSRVTNRIESDPAQFLFGDAQRGYKPR
jgi:phospholipid/cholesterol/gamma-HCH transport system substrate-binding protein